MSKTKTYTVLNPRGIDKGVPILRHNSTIWYEGDDFVQPASISDAALRRWIEQGFLEVKRDA